MRRRGLLRGRKLSFLEGPQTNGRGAPAIGTTLLRGSRLACGTPSPKNRFATLGAAMRVAATRGRCFFVQPVGGPRLVTRVQ